MTNILVSGYNFQNGSIILGQLDGKGGSDNGDNIVVRSIDDIDNYRLNERDKYVSLVQVASADASFITGLSNGNLDQESSSSAEKTTSQEPANNEDTDFLFIDDNYLLSPASYYDETLAESKYGIVKYKVQSGDTPSSIAASFGISTYTVLWANNLKVGDYIKPGQELEILPVTGVKHIVKSGDTLKAIAQKYKADEGEIIMFNNLPADGTFPDGTDGKTLIIPNGENEPPLKPAPIRPIVRDPNERKVVSSSKYRPANLNPLNGHRFPYGYCTWYVASRVYVPWGGDAKMWLTNAKAYGYETGKTPVVGSIVVTTENRRYGHVAYVESVSGSTITVSEMNYVGWGITSVRTISVNSPVIRGYIYLN